MQPGYTGPWDDSHLARVDFRDELGDRTAPQATPLIGVRALMLAMLEDAIRAYLGPAGPDQTDACFWINHSRSNWVFSFSAVCEALCLDPSAVRRALRFRVSWLDVAAAMSYFNSGAVSKL